MDQRRVIAGAIAGVFLFLTIQAFIDFRNQRSVQLQDPTLANLNPSGQSIPLPNTSNSYPTGQAGSISLNDVPSQIAPSSTPLSNEVILVKTDVFEAFINPKGGVIEQVGLNQYLNSIEDQTPFKLITQSGGKTLIAKSGLAGSENLPNHTTTFTASKQEYDLSGGERLVVPLVFENEQVKVVKNFRFFKNSYLITIDYDITNKTSEDLNAFSYGQFTRNEERKGNFFMPSYTGGAVYLDESYQKVSFSDMEDSDLQASSINGWIAAIEHHFFSAWIPPRGEPHQFFTKSLGGGFFNFGVSSGSKFIQGHSEVKAQFPFYLYAGSKDNKILQKLGGDDNTEAIADKLYLTADYGWLAFIARPLFRFMVWLFDLTQSWPIAILLLVLTIKLVFFKLSEAGFRSMAKLRKLSPRLQALKERHGDDKAAMQQEMMGLYKKEKINPLGGCLPILVQIPVFIALYWALLESVEMRQVPFFWIPDLTLPDPFFVLPILMAVTMFIQQWLNPKPTDPTQAMVMRIMPIAFSVFFFFFPAALVFYWVVNNILSIAQQWVINRRIEAEK